MFERSIHTLVNFVDNSVPDGVKQYIKRRNPQFIAQLYWQLTRFTSDRVVEIRIQAGPLRGRAFRCSLKHQRSCYLGNFEPLKASILAEYLSAGAVLFDVGGHIGYFSLLGATLVRPGGQVVAFEPSPVNASQFRTNLAANPDLAPLVRLEETAVAETTGSGAFSRGGNSYVGHLTAAGAEAMSVAITSLDAFVSASGTHPTFVKIDAEGAESRIFDGMSEILRTSRPTLLVEIHDGEAYSRLLGLLRDYSYVGRQIDAETNFSPQPSFRAEAEYLAVPTERA